MSIVDLGRIYASQIERLSETERKVSIKMTLTAPGCSMADILVVAVASKVKLVPTIEEVSVELVLEPPWDYQIMACEAKIETGML